MTHESYVVDQQTQREKLAQEAAEERALINHLNDDYAVEVLFAQHIDIREVGYYQ